MYKMERVSQTHYRQTIYITFDIPVEMQDGLAKYNVYKLLHEIANELEIMLKEGKLAERLSHKGIDAAVTQHDMTGGSA
jgi:hypothetical protein